MEFMDLSRKKLMQIFMWKVYYNIRYCTEYVWPPYRYHYLYFSHNEAATFLPLQFLYATTHTVSNGI